MHSALELVRCSQLLPRQGPGSRKHSLPGLTAHSPPEPPRLSPDHNVTVPPLSSGTLGPRRLLRCSALATSQPRLWLGPPAPLPPGCCHCLLRCAASLLPCSQLPACAGPRPAAPLCKPPVERAFSVVRKLQLHLQARGAGGECHVPHAAAGLRLTASAHGTGGQGQAAGAKAAVGPAGALAPVSMVHGAG